MSPASGRHFQITCVSSMCLWLFLLLQDLCGIVHEKTVMGKGASAALTCLGRLCRHAQGGPRTLEGVSEEGPAVTFHFRLLSLCVFYLRAVSLTALCLQHTPSTHPSRPAGIQLACCGIRGRMELRMKESPFCNAAVNSMGRPKMLVFDFFCFCFSLIFLV